MKRLLILGNSHVAAVMNAWKERFSDNKAYNVEFFAARKNMFEKLRLNDEFVFGGDKDDPEINKYLRAMNGRDRVTLTEFDVIVSVGAVNLWPYFCAIIDQFDVTGLREVGASSIVSTNMFNDLCRAVARTVFPTGPWQNLGDRPVIFVMQPFPGHFMLTDRFDVSELTADQMKQIGKFLPALQNTTGLRAIKQCLVSACNARAAELGYVFLPQRGETEAGSGLTEEKFRRGASRFHASSSFEAQDLAHMNNDYGEFCIREIFARLEV